MTKDTSASMPETFECESSSGGEGRAAEQEVKRIAGDDTNKIRLSKVLVLVFIAVAGAVVSIGINQYLKDQEREEVEHSFELFGNTIEDVSKIHFRTMFDASRAMSRSITSEAFRMNMTFPFVTIQDFEMLGNEARSNSPLEAIGLSIELKKEEIVPFGQYAVENAPGWMAESQRLEKEINPSITTEYEPFDIIPFVYELVVDPETYEQSIMPSTGEGRTSVVWQVTPPPTTPFLLMSDTITSEVEPQLLQGTLETQDTVITSVDASYVFYSETTMTKKRHDAVHSRYPMSGNPYTPHTAFAVPVFDSFYRSDRRHVADLVSVFSVEAILVNLLPEGVRGVYLIVENTCDQKYTFKLDGRRAEYLGPGDLSETTHGDQERLIVFDDMYENATVSTLSRNSCVYSYRLRKGREFDDIFSTDLPIVFAVIVACIFLLMGFAFVVYDCIVSRRNVKVMSAAVRSTAIVTSLFPSTVRDRLYEGNANSAATATSKARLKKFVDKGVGFDNHIEAGKSREVVLESKPIADLFPDTTVMFADIAGFTAWSSMREPEQVFTLLETVYRAFDRLAKERHVFKIETVGDCYVAVAGCPDPVANHPVIMAKFARECINTMAVLTKQLEVNLGPDTGDLQIRIGLHSGPVTAGVLRGERARFQLFGDTMNTASRMESTGQRGRIQVSYSTAVLLTEAGKEHWLMERSDLVFAKGKGAMKTFWLIDNESNSSESKSIKDLPTPSVSKRVDVVVESDASKMDRLIDWNVDVLSQSLKQIIARRCISGKATKDVSIEAENRFMESHSGSALKDVEEIIHLPKFAECGHANYNEIVLAQEVKMELRAYVTSIASVYQKNPFHNFEHASHVAMSVVKLLSRIVSPKDEVLKTNNVASSMHDHTYGITSDPLTPFACVMAALIHDADHPGVPNAQLVKEGHPLAVYYANKSVAEQNSVDLAWNLLMDGAFRNLRAAIYTSQEEMQRFRQLIVNSVMATDIVDKELKKLRNARWERAFDDAVLDRDEQDTVNRKATIVIEHLIQASDVAHTMQHWHIYRKWNEKFFMECYQAFKDGRASADPTENWYSGELGFFDFYIIPLAKKLKDCGVFGVSSDEYLQYALSNRQEWEQRGQEIVAFIVEKVNRV